MVRVLKQVELDEDIYSLGLRGTIDAAARPDLAGKILKARHTLHEHLQDGTYAGLVEPFQRRPLQQEPVGGREPAVRHRARQAVRRRQPRDRSLRDVGAEEDRARPRPAADGPQHRRDHGRTLLGPVARQSAVRAVQLHLRGRVAQRPPAAATSRRQGHRGGARSGSHPADDPAVPLHRGAPSPRPDRRGDGGAHPRCPACLCRRPARQPAGRRRVLRFRTLQQCRHPAGQHPVRPLGLWAGTGGGAHRDPDRPGVQRAWPPRFGDRGRPGIQCGRRRQATALDAAPEARHRPGDDQASRIDGGQRGGRHVRRPHPGPHPRQRPGLRDREQSRRGLDRQPAQPGRAV